eukprot:gene163-775_t
MDAETASRCLKVVAVCSQGLTAGAALYITIVEVPARMSHDMTTAIRNWKPFFNRAKKTQGLVSIFGILAGPAIYMLDRGTPRECLAWPITSSIVFTVIPYTLLGMMPLNNELLETDKCIEKGDGWIKENLNKWACCHFLRTVINVGAFGVLAYTAVNCSK